jgi:hypothetical protein
MAYRIQLALGPFISSQGVYGRNLLWEAHEHNQHFGENESTDIGTGQRHQKEGNARINMLSAMKPDFKIIIAKIHISRYFESPETYIHIARNAFCINYADTWLSKRVH